MLLSALTARATSVVPPSFPQLVAEAQSIFEGTVTAVDCRWVDTSAGRVIKTFVTFSVDRTIKGNPGTNTTLEFLGGTVGDETMRVSGMPEFHVGEHELLFTQGNGLQFCPLVRFGHGRYRVHTDATTHRRYLTRNDGAPLTAPSDVSSPENDGAAAHALRSADAALSPSTFENAIRAELAQPSR